MSRRIEHLRFGVLVLPALAAMSAFYFYPIIRVLWMSFTLPSPGFQNYVDLADSVAARRVLWNTLKISMISTAVTLLLGYCVAYVLVHLTAAKRRLMLAAVLASLWISVLVRAFAWFTLLRSDGLINQALRGLGIITSPLRLMWNELGVTIGVTHAMLPLAILPLYAGMVAIDPRLVAAARGLGATRFRAFWIVFFPLSLPGLFGAGILVSIYALGFYITPALLGGGKKLMVAEYIKIQILDVVNWGTGSAVAALLLSAIVAMLLVVGRMTNLNRLFGAS